MHPVLAIDTCGGAGYACLVDADTAAILAGASLPARETQERLFPAIQKVLHESACAPEELRALAVVTGPGSFTGVRIGMATLKGLAEALGVPVVAFSRLTVLGAAARASLPQAERVHVWMDAGRGDVYAGLGSAVSQEGSAVSQEAERLCSIEAAAASLQPGDAVAVLEAPLLAHCPRPAHLLSEEVYREHFAAMTARAVRAGQFVDMALLDAHYLRRPDAEVSLLARMAQGVGPSQR